MRFYSNENFPQPVVEALRKLGHDLVTSLQAGRANQRIEHADVLAHAHANRRAVLTLNRKHFRRLHQTGVSHSGIIACTEDFDFDGQARRIDTAVRSRGDLTGTLIHVTKRG